VRQGGFGRPVFFWLFLDLFLKSRRDTMANVNRPVLVRIVCLLAMAAVLWSCGSGGYGSSNPPPTPPPPAQLKLDLIVTGLSVVKIQASASTGTVVLEERLTSLTQAGPDRSLVILDLRGTETGRCAAPPGLAMIDFAQHPSGEISLVLATATAVRITRVDRSCTVLFELALDDPQAANDPFFDTGGLHDDHSLLPVFTRDAVRVAPIGESLAVALRSGRNATVAYRLDRAGAGYARAWRTLVEPGVSVFLIGITSGSYDEFHALENHMQLRIDADTSGNIVVGVPSKFQSAPIFAAHSAFFGEPIAAQDGALITRLSPGGTRIGTTVIDTRRPSEMHGLRIAGDDIAIVGRVFSEQRSDGSGWDAWSARVSRADGSLASYRPLDVEQGEILFDIGSFRDGKFIAVGAAGYTQNPTGASVSEASTPLLVILESDGRLAARIHFTPGIPFPVFARQNQVRTLAAVGETWLIGGLVNGPGTHSGDADPRLIAADGYARELTIPN